MANIIDALVVTLGLDAKGFKQGQKDASDATKKLADDSNANAKKVEADAKKMAEGFNKVKGELISLISVMLGSAGVKAFVSQMTDVNAALGRMAHNLGENPKVLDAWAAAVRNVGGSKEDLYATAAAIEDIYENYKKTGQLSPEVAKAIQAFGLKPEDMQSPDKFFRQLTIGMSKFKGTIQDKLSFSKDLGVKPSAFNLFNEAPDHVFAMVNGMGELSGVTDKNIESAKHLQEQWGTLLQTFDGVAQDIFGAIAPSLEKLMDLVDGLGRKFLDFDRASGGIPATILSFGTAAVAILAPLRLVFGLLRSIAGIGASATAAAAGVASGAVTALAAGTAGAAGWFAGKEINKHLSDSTKDAIGGTLHGMLHGFGLDDALPGDEDYKGVAPRTTSPTSGIGPNAPRGARNNNPGNLNFAGQPYNTGRENGGTGRFATFGTMEQGVFNIARQLQLYAGRGINTIQGIVETWAPKKDHNDVAAYIAALTKQTGAKADQSLDLTNEKMLQALIRGIVNQEGNGKFVTDAQISSGMHIGAAPSANRVSAAPNNTTTSETTFNGPINVVTQSKDADSIARDMNIALQRRISLVSASNGMTP